MIQPRPKFSIAIELIILILLIVAPLSGQTVVFNEIISSNAELVPDENGDCVDWIELYNTGDQTAVLCNFGLSDDPEIPSKWVFPFVTLEPGNHLLLYASGKDRRSWAKHIETVIRQGDEWKYLMGASAPPYHWRNIEFNHDNWLIGRSGFGYGDNDDETTIDRDIYCIYLRKVFNLEDTESIVYTLLHMDYDDGFVAYINGQEIARANMDQSNSIPKHNDLALQNHEALIYRGLPPELFQIENFQNILVQGDNVLSIQVHNSDSSSSDLSLIPFLTIGWNCERETQNEVVDVLRPSLPCLHTNFKIGQEGESLLLSNAEGEVIDQVFVPSLPPKVSYGRYPDGNSTWFYYQMPTPFFSNSPGRNVDVSVPPRCDPPAGIYWNPVEITLTPPNQNCSIYYTLDGSPPTVESIEYDQPILIDTSRVLRSVTIEPQHVPSSVVTNSYIYYETDLPIISLSTDPANLFDEETGIYVFGTDYDQRPPYRGANFWNDWERPIHLEFFEPTDPSNPNSYPGFSIDAGVKIFGGWSRIYPQRSLSIFGRSQYNSGGGIDYQIFPEMELNRFESIVLRNSGSDWNHTMFRDAFITSLVKDRDIDTQAYRPAVVFINGIYWGIHNIREKINEHFIASHHQVAPDIIDFLDISGNTLNGDCTEYEKMIDFLDTHNLSDSANFQYIANQIDVDNFINYNTTNIYIGNSDWPGRNCKFYKICKLDRKWRWIMFDTDFGFGLYSQARYNHNTLEWATDPSSSEVCNPPHSTFLLRKMLDNSSFKIDFINRLADLMNVNFNPEQVIQSIDKFSSKIHSEIPNHLDRWDRSYDDWEWKVDYIRNFARLRPAVVRDHVIEKFNLSGTSRIEIDIIPQGAGEIHINSVIPSEYPWTGIYFNDNPIQIKAYSNPSYTFKHWELDIESDIAFKEFTLQNDQQITALFEALPENNKSIVINEINYNSSPDFDTEDWVELYVQSGNHDLTNCFISDSNDDNRFTFPDGTILLENQYLIVTHDSSAFRSFFPNVENVIGNIDFNFGNNGDQIRLFGAGGSPYDSIFYRDCNEWPHSPDGDGPTLELINPDCNGTNPDNWRISPFQQGSPGRGHDYHAPSEFSLIKPADGSTVEGEAIRLWWNSSFDPDSVDDIQYRIEWSINNDFKPLLKRIISDTTFLIEQIAIDNSHVIPRLQNGQIVFWRVFATENSGLETVGNSSENGWCFRNEFPIEFDVYPAYPNPFNHTVTISVALPEAGAVSFKLYNVLGRELFRSTQDYSIGTHQFRIEADKLQQNLAGGLYILRIKFGEMEKVQKVVLLK